MKNVSMTIGNNKKSSVNNLVGNIKLKRASKTVNLNSTPLNISSENMFAKLKAYEYKNECIEALREGKMYASPADMMADVKNW